MIPYNYRRLLEKGFEESFCKHIWGARWDELRETTIAGLLTAVPVDVSPILHILNIPSVVAMPEEESTNLFPPWPVFYFEKPFPFDETVTALLYDNLSPDEISRILASLKGKYRLDGILVYVIKVSADGNVSGKAELSIARRVPDGHLYQVTGLNYKGPHDSSNRRAFVSYGFVFATDRNGCLQYDDSSKGVYCQLLLPSFPGMSKDLTYTQLSQDMQADCHTVCRFLHFMQCRNIKARRRHFPDYKPRKHQRHKVYKYYELTVVKPSINEINQPHGEGVKGKALHAVRGHIAHYTPDHPLFGRADLYGDFFIPQHVRGDLQYGKVEKTYKTKSAWA